jgi:hypothetical protein
MVEGRVGVGGAGGRCLPSQECLEHERCPHADEQQRPGGTSESRRWRRASAVAALEGIDAVRGSRQTRVGRFAVVEVGKVDPATVAGSAATQARVRAVVFPVTSDHYGYLVGTAELGLAAIRRRQVGAGDFEAADGALAGVRQVAHAQGLTLRE